MSDSFKRRLCGIEERVDLASVVLDQKHLHLNGQSRREDKRALHTSQENLDLGESVPLIDQGYKH